MVGMAQPSIELILLRQWASYLTLPMLVMGADGELAYFNEAAEPLLGRSYEEMGALSLAELSARFALTTEAGASFTPATMPLGVAWRTRWPVHALLRLRGLDGVWRLVEVTALPMTGQGGRLFGVVALFWEAVGQGL